MDSINPQEYLAEVIRNHHPKFEYSRVDDLMLGEAWFFSRFVADELLFMILYRSGRLPIDFPEWRDIRKDLKPANLLHTATRLRELCPDRQLIDVLADAILENAAITRELRTRLKDKPVGKDLILVDQGRKTDINALEKLLKFDSITSYRRSKYDAKDIQQDAWVKTLQVYRKQGSTALRQHAGRIRPISPPQIQLHQPEREFWDKIVLLAWFNNLKRYIEKVLPILNQSTERIPEQTRQALRSKFEKWKAKKRTGKDVPLRVADRVLLSRSDSRTWRKGAERIDGAEDKADLSAQMFAVLKEAQKHKRWGPKAIKALKYVSDGKTEKEAAQLAGITSKTLRNDIARLRKIFSSKK
jgi:hypothetical protein